MPISSGFSQDPYPNYYVRKPGQTEILDEAIYYKHDEPFQRPPVEIVNRPVIKETAFMPDRRALPPLIAPRDAYTVAPESGGMVYTTPSNTMPSTSFDLVRALGLNADCPCWSWICIVLSFIILLGLIGMCLYFILHREGYV